MAQHLVHFLEEAFCSLPFFTFAALYSVLRFSILRYGSCWSPQTHGNTTTTPQFHSEEWMRKQLTYLGAAATNYEEAAPFS